MSWCDGEQKVAKFRDYNSIVKELSGNLNDLEARVTLAQFLRHNIGFTFFLLTGFELLPMQEILLKQLFLKDNGLIVAGRGGSKCADENSLIITNNGIKQIKDCKVGEEVFSKNNFNKILAKIENPLEEGIEIETKRGFINKGKIGHKILVYNDKDISLEYVNIEDINNNSYIPIRYGIDYWLDKDIFVNYNWNKKFHGNAILDCDVKNEDDFYYLLGLIVGDGSIDSKTEKNIQITSNDDYIIQFVYRKLQEYLPSNSINIGDKTGTTAKNIRVSSKKFVDFLKYIGINPQQKSHKKEFPRLLLNCNKKHICEFIKGLYDTDGYISIKNNKQKNSQSVSIGFTSTSKDLIIYLQTILLDMGIVSGTSICHKAGPYKFSNGKTYNTHAAYTLRITGYTNVVKFHKDVGFRLKRKQDILDKFINEYKKDVDYNTNYIPNIGVYLKNKYRSSHFRKHGFKIHKNLSINRLKYVIDKNLLDESDTIKINNLINSNIYIDSVKQSNKIQTKTYDIQIENEECYWCQGFINHNSTIISIYALLYPLFRFNSKLCLISANFRGARRILEFSEKLINGKGGFLLKQCIPDRMERGNYQYRLKIGEPSNSEVFALPLTGDGIRGTRATSVCLDEGLLLNKSIQENIIRPFLTAKQDFQEEQRTKKIEDELIAAGRLKEEDRISFPKNQFHVFSSASYKFEYLYEIYEQMIKQIMGVDKEESPPSYFVCRFSYEALPKESFIDMTQIDAAKRSIGENSESFKREYRALFSDSSDGYFNVKAMKECTIEPNSFPTTQLQGEKGSEYILTIDPSYSASKTSDFFAMGVYLLNKDERKLTLVHTYGKAGTDLKDHYEYLIYLLTFFNIVFIVIDASGTEFITGFNESSQAKNKSLNLSFITAQFDDEDPREYLEQINIAQKQYNVTSRKIVYAQKFLTGSLRHMNEHLQNQITAKKVWFASPAQTNDKVYERYLNLDLPIQFKDFKDQSQGRMEMILDQDEWINQTKSQLALIEVKATVTGTLQYDLPSEIRNQKSVNRPRKDNYTCLLLGIWGMKIYFDLMFTQTKENNDVFIPILI